DGIRRVIRFLEDMDLAILSGFRRVRPRGLGGGDDGRLAATACGVCRSARRYRRVRRNAFEAGEAITNRNADGRRFWPSDALNPRPGLRRQGDGVPVDPLSRRSDMNASNSDLSRAWRNPSR
ncbi:MAG: hypothetical protein HOP09_00005, partial [Hyphomicrobium sp.]|nr:hypothetical protein [Hyphomicrobium sp.]